MNLDARLKHEIVTVLHANVKAQMVPSFCSGLGLEFGTADEA